MPSGVVAAPAPAPKPVAAPPSTELPRPDEGAHEAVPSVSASASLAPSTPSPASDFSRQLTDCRSAFTHGRMRDALTDCAAAVATNPSSAEALTMLAHAELNRGRLSQANELATKAVAISPNLADAYVIIGGVHQDSGRNREAKAAYRRYLQLAPHGRYADELRSIVNGL
jgi:tetratricopeptide (TPR) repeat protein